MQELINKIHSQQALVEKIRLLQGEERKLRLEVSEALFGKDVIGNKKTQVGNMIVTGEFALTYTVNQKDIEAAVEQDLLSDDAMEAIRIKYELDKRKYNGLDDEVVEEINDYLTIKPALPSIKVKLVEDDKDE